MDLASGRSCIHHGQRQRVDRVDRRDKSIFRLGRLWLLDILRRAPQSCFLEALLPIPENEYGLALCLTILIQARFQASSTELYCLFVISVWEGGVIWAGWHVPWLIAGVNFPGQNLWLALLVFLFSTVSVSLVFTRFYVVTGGSVLLVGLLHGLRGVQALDKG